MAGKKEEDGSVKVFDEIEALKNSAGDKYLLREMLCISISEIPRMMEIIKKNIWGENYSAASIIAHEIKGTAGICGAGHLYDAASGMETACRDAIGDWDNLLNCLIEAAAAFFSHSRVRVLAALDGH